MARRHRRGRPRLARGRDPLWTRAWAALPQQSVDAAALAVAVLVAVLAAAAAPLVVASVGNDVVARHLSALTPEEGGVTVTIRGAVGSPHQHAAVAQGVDRQLASPHLDTQTSSLVGSASGIDARLFRVDPTDPRAQEQRLTEATARGWTEGSRPSIRLASAAVLLDAMEVVARWGEEGVWVAEPVAEELDLRPGDEVIYTASNRAPSPDGAVRRRIVRLPVAGVYRDPWAGGELAASWHDVPSHLLPPAPPQDRTDRAPKLLVGDAATIQRASAAVGEHLTVRLRHDLLTPDLTVPEVAALRSRLDALERELADGRSALRQALVELASPQTRPDLESGVPAALQAARDGQRAVLGQVRSLTFAAVALGLGVVAAAAAFVTDRRRVQCRALWLQGVSPAAFALRRVWELLPALAVGAVAGWGSGLLAARLAGPWSGIEASWIATSVRWAAVAAVAAAVVLLATTTASAYRVVAPRRGRAGGWVLLLALLVGTAAALVAVREQGQGEAGVLVQGLPLLLAACGAIAGAAVLDLVLALVPARRVRPWLQLAVVRLRSGLRGGGVLLAAVAVAASAAIYAGALTGAARDGTDDKVLALAGARSIVSVNGSLADVPDLPPELVPVLRATVHVAPGGEAAHLMVLDTAHAERAGVWGEGLATVAMGPPLEAIRRRGAELLPVLATGRGHAPDGQAVTLRGARFALEAEVAATPAAWPGMGANRPLYVADLQTVRAQPGAFGDAPSIVDPAAEPLEAFPVEIWSDLGAAEVAGRLEAAGMSVRTTRDLDAEQVRSQLTAQAATVDFLVLLGAVASTVAVAAVALHVSARQRERVLSYALSRRMGLTAWQHRLALAGELGGLVLLAVALAVPVTVAASRLVVPLLDPLPEVAPTLTGRMPSPVVAAVVAAAGVVAAVASGVAHRLTATTDVTGALRVAE